MTLPVKKSYLKNKLELIYTSDGQPGFRRKKWGCGFVYLDENEQKVSCRDTIKRIKELTIPPIWEKVWICKLDNGHLQSTGLDPKKRKQYIYHPDWISFRQDRKFSKLVDFANTLPKIREITERELQHKTWTKEKVLALAIKVLDQYHIRIGNRQYANRNSTYGLTTLRRKHLEIENGALQLAYKAKSNKLRKVSIQNKSLIKLIKKCASIPGYEVFRYLDEAGKSQTLKSEDVNEYIQEVMGSDFSAKDFRTWAGTSLAVKHLSKAKEICARHPQKKLEPTLVKLVAKELGNTMTVCRKYYIHPLILDFVKTTGEFPEVETADVPFLEPYEHTTIQLLRG